MCITLIQVFIAISLDYRFFLNHLIFFKVLLRKTIAIFYFPLSFTKEASLEVFVRYTYRADKNDGVLRFTSCLKRYSSEYRIVSLI